MFENYNRKKVNKTALSSNDDKRLKLLHIHTVLMHLWCVKKKSQKKKKRKRNYRQRDTIKVSHDVYINITHNSLEGIFTAKIAIHCLRYKKEIIDREILLK